MRRKLKELARNYRHGWATSYPAVGINYRPPSPPTKENPIGLIRKRLGLTSAVPLVSNSQKPPTKRKQKPQ